jgi:tetratricopeptide (TPR) repeat protein
MTPDVKHSNNTGRQPKPAKKQSAPKKNIAHRSKKADPSIEIDALRHESKANLGGLLLHSLRSKITPLRLRRALVYFLVSVFPLIWLFYAEVIPRVFPKPPVRMSGEWNVMVAGFANLNTDLHSTDIKLIHDVFFNRFEQEMLDLGNDTNLVVQVGGSEQIGSISGNSAEERASEAEKVANEINADMVIYGNVQQVEDGYVLQPEFYIRADNYYEAEELIGQHRFGGPISIIATRDALPSQIQLNIELTRRAKILALVTRGLSLYLIKSYDQAFELFTQANQDDLWSISTGRESVYLFQANAALLQQQFDQARSALEQAVKINPDYGRGYIGLGIVHYVLASESASQTSFTPDGLELKQSMDFYEKALSVAETQPSSAEIPSKAAFGIGQIYLTKWILGEDTRDRSIEEFQKVITRYADGQEPQLQELASESHARLAVIYRQDNQIDIALAEFEQALRLSTSPARKGLYHASISAIYRQQGDMPQADSEGSLAIEQYQIALGLPVSDKSKALYWAKIAEQYGLLQNNAEARNAYENALELLPVDSPDYEIYQQRLQALPH